MLDTRHGRIYKTAIQATGTLPHIQRRSKIYIKHDPHGMKPTESIGLITRPPQPINNKKGDTNKTTQLWAMKVVQIVDTNTKMKSIQSSKFSTMLALRTSHATASAGTAMLH